MIFTNIQTSISYSVSIFSFVSPDDNPPFDSRGKTSLVIDDFAWTNGDLFLLLVFSSNAFGIMPRLGSSLIQIFNPTLLNISQTMIDLFDHYKHPRAFSELILPMWV